MRMIPLAAALALALGAAAGAQTSPPPSPPDARTQLALARADYARVRANAGPTDAPMLEPLALEQRLTDDAETVGTPRPADWPQAEWDDMLAALVGLDTDLVAQLSRGPRSFALTPGLRAFMLRSAVDGTVDSLATYVPANVQVPASVAIVLHGNPQTETELLGQPYLRRLADETGTILVAPHGRGAYDNVGPATADIYGIATLLHRMPALAKARFYLVGYSMGGFSVFKIGPDAPVKWNAVFDISGSLVGSAAPAVLARWHDTPIYVVFGERDTSIPTHFGRDTALYLFQQDVPVGYYEQPGGTHHLRTLMPALHAAWLDMQRGFVRNDEIARMGTSGMRRLPPATTRPAQGIRF